MPTRSGSLLLVLLFAATALAGCHGLEDDEGGDPSPTPSPSPTDSPNATASPTPSPTTTPTGTPSPEGPNITLTIDNAPANVTVDDTIVLNVTVTGDQVEASIADVYYAYASTQPDDDDLTPDRFNGSIEGNGNTTFPGRYSTVNWTIDDNRTLYVRAHILFGGDHYWSAEAIIAVNEPEASPPIGKIAEIVIDTRPEQFPCQLANFQGSGGGALAPTQTNIFVGEAVVFISKETAAGCVHDATPTSTPPGFEATGDIENGETTEPIQFLLAGTYDFECSYHPDTMTGRIVVQAKPGG